MDVKELLDEDAFDPKKLFDEKEYSTLIVNREGFSKKENSLADLIETLLDKTVTREELEAIFTRLKEEKAQNLLVSSIKGTNKDDQKARLVAACWESGLDFSKHFIFFTELACSTDFQLAMEALTVIEYCEEAIDEGTLKRALEIAEKSSGPHPDLAHDLVSNIKDRIH